MSIATLRNQNNTNEALLEKVLLKSDLQGLTPIETVHHIKNICDSLGLNPLTNPIEAIEFQGKKKLYFTKQATEQLRVIKHISVSIKETKLIDDLYIVIAEAKTPEGRYDTSTAAIAFSHLKGQARADAMMKCETKAKRRVTLSICGLGYLDESETESLPNYKKINVDKNENKLITKEVELDDSTLPTKNEMDDMDLQSDIEKINLSKNLEDLQKSYRSGYSYWVNKRDKERLHKIVEAKDKKKFELERDDFVKEMDESKVDIETGEIKND